MSGAAPSCVSEPYRLVKGICESLSPSQTYRLAHRAECKLFLSMHSADRNLRFVVGHAFIFEKSMLRIVEIEEEESRKGGARDSVIEGNLYSEICVNPIPRTSELQPDVENVELERPGSDADSISTESDDEDASEELALTLSVSRITINPPAPTASASSIPELTPSSDHDSTSSDSEDDTPARHGISDRLLEKIIEQPGDEKLAELYGCIASCSCQPDVAPAIEQIWEITPEMLEGQETSGAHKNLDEETSAAVRRIRGGRRLSVVRVQES